MKTQLSEASQNKLKQETKLTLETDSKEKALEVDKQYTKAKRPRLSINFISLGSDLVPSHLTKIPFDRVIFEDKQ